MAARLASRVRGGAAVLGSARATRDVGGRRNRGRRRCGSPGRFRGLHLAACGRRGRGGRGGGGHVRRRIRLRLGRARLEIDSFSGSANGMKRSMCSEPIRLARKVMSSSESENLVSPCFIRSCTWERSATAFCDRQIDDPSARALMLRPGLNLPVAVGIETRIPNVQLEALEPLVAQFQQALIGGCCHGSEAPRVP